MQPIRPSVASFRWFPWALLAATPRGSVCRISLASSRWTLDKDNHQNKAILEKIYMAGAAKEQEAFVLVFRFP